jgi:hypothetical protein
VRPLILVVAFTLASPEGMSALSAQDRCEGKTALVAAAASYVHAAHRTAMPLAL